MTSQMSLLPNKPHVFFLIREVEVARCGIVSKSANHHHTQFSHVPPSTALAFSAEMHDIDENLMCD